MPGCMQGMCLYVHGNRSVLTFQMVRICAYGLCIKEACSECRIVLDGTISECFTTKAITLILYERSIDSSWSAGTISDIGIHTLLLIRIV